MKDARRGRAVAPFAVEKGVGTEVNDGAHLHVLPRHLLRRWLHIDSVLRDRRGRCERKEHGKMEGAHDGYLSSGSDSAIGDKRRNEDGLEYRFVIAYIS